MGRLALVRAVMRGLFNWPRGSAALQGNRSGQEERGGLGEAVGVVDQGGEPGGGGGR